MQLNGRFFHLCNPGRYKIASNKINKKHLDCSQTGCIFKPPAGRHFLACGASDTCIQRISSLLRRSLAGASVQLGRKVPRTEEVNARRTDEKPSCSYAVPAARGQDSNASAAILQTTGTSADVSEDRTVQLRYNLHQQPLVRLQEAYPLPVFCVSATLSDPDPIIPRPLRFDSKCKPLPKKPLKKVLLREMPSKGSTSQERTGIVLLPTKNADDIVKNASDRDVSTFRRFAFPLRRSPNLSNP
jgi:hypothetical protein